jgi:hypothetical protein
MYALKGYLVFLFLLASSNLLAEENTIVMSPEDGNSLQDRVSIGAGIGSAYGFSGLNLGYRYSKQTQVILGSGYRGAVIGGYWYPSDSWQSLRLSAIYGPNSILDVCTGSPGCKLEEKVYSGFMFGLGIGSHYSSGWEFDIQYVATKGDYDKDIERNKRIGVDQETNAGSEVRFSLGYRWLL